MTVDDILAIPQTQIVFFRDEELRAFCDLFEHELHQAADWDAVRRADYVMGMPHPPLFLDEIERVWIGQALGRDWYVRNRADPHWLAVDRSARANREP